MQTVLVPDGQMVYEVGEEGTPKHGSQCSLGSLQTRGSQFRQGRHRPRVRSQNIPQGQQSVGEFLGS